VNGDNDDIKTNHEKSFFLKNPYGNTPPKIKEKTPKDKKN